MATSLPQWIAAFVKPANRGSHTPTVARVQILPGDLTIRQNTKAVLVAVGYDYENNPISGLSFAWSQQDAAGRFPARNFASGVFKGSRAGEFTITAQNGGQQSQITVTVLPVDPEEGQLTNDKTAIPVSLRSGTKSKEKSTIEKGQSLNSLVGEGSWTDDNWLSAGLPGNQTGTPPGGPVDGGAGNGNFQLSAPVVSLPGRGIDLALNLNYNSRVWNKAGNQLTYDIDHGQPAPGWSLGFGKIVFMGSDGGCMMIDADGTRRGYAGSINPWSTGMTFQGSWNIAR